MATGLSLVHTGIYGVSVQESLICVLKLYSALFLSLKLLPRYLEWSVVQCLEHLVKAKCTDSKTVVARSLKVSASEERYTVALKERTTY
jgi:hypothetical protein